MALTTARPRKRRGSDDAAFTVSRIQAEIDAGLDVKSACRQAGVSVPSYYRWRARMGGTGEKSREAILAAAKVVFLKDGYSANLDSVARAAGVARQTLYNQFGSKEKLFVEVVQMVYRNLASPVLIVEHGEDFLATLTNFGRAFLRMALNPESLALQRVALSQYSETPELAKTAYALRASHAIPVLTDAIASWLAAQMEKGVIDRADPLMAAEAFGGSFTAHSRHRLLIGMGGDAPERQEEMLKFCVNIFACGLGYQPTV